MEFLRQDTVNSSLNYELKLFKIKENATRNFLSLAGYKINL